MGDYMVWLRDYMIWEIYVNILVGRVLNRTLLLCITWYELTNQNAPFALLCPYMVLKGPEILLFQNPHYPTTKGEGEDPAGDARKYP